mmetsp:Transcript_36832/g.72314  ORF Transcript_36832/g.72314 Transcript_36832/m.72314 type:complete len:216 (-) Transcript_36832:651-1298(-)
MASPRSLASSSSSSPSPMAVSNFSIFFFQLFALTALCCGRGRAFFLCSSNQRLLRCFFGFFFGSGRLDSVLQVAGLLLQQRLFDFQFLLRHFSCVLGSCELRFQVLDLLLQVGSAYVVTLDGLLKLTNLVLVGLFQLLDLFGMRRLQRRYALCVLFVQLSHFRALAFLLCIYLFRVICFCCLERLVVIFFQLLELSTVSLFHFCQLFFTFSRFCC